MKKARKNIMAGIIKICGICGKKFTTYRQQSRYCGETCRKEAKQQNNAETRRKISEAKKEKRGIKICLVCGREFEPKRSNSVTCNAVCGNERYKNIKAAAKAEQKEEKKEIEPAWMINAKARAMGLTYGKYELMKRLEAQRAERSRAV